MNQPAKRIQCLISIRPALVYLINALAESGCENEVAYSVLNLLTTAVLTLEKHWTEQDEIDTAIEYLEGVAGFDHEFVVGVCRQAEAMISSAIYEHVPDFGKDTYYGQTSFEFKTDDSFLLTINTAAFS